MKSPKDMKTASCYEPRTNEEIIARMSEFTDISKLTRGQLDELTKFAFALTEVGKNKLWEELEAIHTRMSGFTDVSRLTWTQLVELTKFAFAQTEVGKKELWKELFK